VHAREIVVERPPEAVYRLLVEPAERARWQSSFEEQPLAAPLRVGSRIRARRRGSTSGSSYELVVTALEPGRRLAMDAYRNGQLVAVNVFLLAPEGVGGTRVRGEAEVRLTGLQRVLAPVVGAELERRLGEELAALKRHAESG
jgi:uncharacterized protein YndB with AHSA1/START domain